MSYILDALRKSEQQRLQGESPLLVTTQTSFSVRKQPAFLFYGLLAAILICAGILIGWLRPWQQDETEAAKDSSALAQNEAKLPQIAPMSLPIPYTLPPKPETAKKSEPVLPVQKPMPVTKAVAAQTSTEQHAPMPAPVPTKIAAQARESQTGTNQPKVVEQKIDEIALANTEKPTPPSLEPSNTNDAHTATDEPSQEHKVVAMSALPLAIQQEIPTMAISGHAYSVIPKERIVGINDRLLQEGEYLVPGLKLEHITEDGLIFSYKKYLFRHSL